MRLIHFRKVLSENRVIKQERSLNIVCISPAPWDYPVWTNRQHIMSRMAQEHNVIYVFHPPLLRSSIKRDISIKNIKIVSMFKKIKNSLLIFTPFVLPFSRKFLFIHRLNIKISAMFLKRKLKQLRIEKFVLWFYDPEAFYYLDYVKPMLSCYDCVDDYSAMPFYRRSQKAKNRLKHLERNLVEKCDLVFTTSINLYIKKKQENPNTFLVENVGDFDHFSKAQSPSLGTPPDFPSGNRPVIGFVGALDSYKVDFRLINYVASRKPNWSFVLIGGKQSSSDKTISFPKKSNIYYLGRKKYEDLPKYISEFDVCMIPYKINDYTKHVFPIKLFEFLSSGKPVIITGLPSLEKYRDTVMIARSEEEFMQLIEEVLFNHSEELRKKRINLAKNNTWETRAGKLISYIYDTLPDKLR